MFLNDWGSAAQANKVSTPAGALRFYPTDVLHDMIEATKRKADALGYTVRPRHDLEMLVKVLFTPCMMPACLTSLGHVLLYAQG